MKHSHFEQETKGGKQLKKGKKKEKLEVKEKKTECRDEVEDWMI